MDRLHVYTFREGLLARVGHDLQIEATRFTFLREGEELVLRVPVSGLLVRGSMDGPRLDPGGVSTKDKAEIEENMRSAVLEGYRHPEIVARGRLGAGELQLELVGRSQRVAVPLHHAGGRVQGTVELQPSRWGIKPFKALLGALRLQDRVRVEFDLALPPG